MDCFVNGISVNEVAAVIHAGYFFWICRIGVVHDFAVLYSVVGWCRICFRLIGFRIDTVFVVKLAVDIDVSLIADFVFAGFDYIALFQLDVDIADAGSLVGFACYFDAVFTIKANLVCIGYFIGIIVTVGGNHPAQVFRIGNGQGIAVFGTFQISQACSCFFIRVFFGFGCRSSCLSIFFRRTVFYIVLGVVFIPDFN